MIEFFKEIEKANDSTLWYLLGKVSELLKAELDASNGNATGNSKVWFWYELYRVLRNELDKRMVQEG